MQPLHPLRPTALVTKRTMSSASFAFLLVTFMAGLASSLQSPALSVYLHNEVTKDPFLVGLFYAVNAGMAMLLSQIIAFFSDRYPQRKNIIIFACIMQLSGCLLFAFNRDYYVLLLGGTIFIGLGASVTPQIFAFAREYTQSQQRDSTMFNTVLRAQISLAWIMGPPLAFYISSELGFSFMYSAAATIFAIAVVVVTLLLPKVVKKPAHTQAVAETETFVVGPYSNRRATLLLFITCLMLWTCNSMMFVNMPLYITQDLGQSERLAGIMMGTAAGIEIPVMLIAGYCTRFISKKTMMIIAVIAAFCYYIGLGIAQTQWHLIAIQLFNGIFVGILASIGMLYFQDLMPYRMGTATTLFNNAGAASWVLGGPLAGFIAKGFDFHSTWNVALFLIIVSFFALMPVRKL